MFLPTFLSLPWSCGTMLTVTVLLKIVDLLKSLYLLLPSSPDLRLYIRSNRKWVFPDKPFIAVRFSCLFPCDWPHALPTFLNISKQDKVWKIKQNPPVPEVTFTVAIHRTQHSSYLLPYIPPFKLESQNLRVTRNYKSPDLSILHSAGHLCNASPRTFSLRVNII